MERTPKLRKTTIYVAGPMTNGSAHHYNLAKIHEAIEVSLRLIELGYAPYCPHLSVFYELMNPNRIPYATWLELDRTYINLSDVVFRVSGPSVGADREVALARSLGIPVVHSFDELFDALSLGTDPLKYRVVVFNRLGGLLDPSEVPS
jgi:hypothetical protein